MNAILPSAVTAMSAPAAAAVEHILFHCGGLAGEEATLIVCDPATRGLGEDFLAVARSRGARATLIETPAVAMHGMEPSTAAAAAMAAADLVVGLRGMSMAHTAARQAVTRKGGRYLSLPEFSHALLADPSIMVDYRARAPVVRRVTALLTAGGTARITGPSGTDVSVEIAGRTGNCCPGAVLGPGELGSPPDIEANISPLETRSHGRVVVDGSIPCAEIGILRTPVTLSVRDGAIVAIDAADPGLVRTLEALFARAGSPKARILAEVGIGLNPRARLTGVMLTDEGAQGHYHFGFGSNATVGGLNDVGFHLDFVFRGGTVWVDGRPVLEAGELLV